MSERREEEETVEPILAIIIFNSAWSMRALSALGVCMGGVSFLPREFRPSSYSWCRIILSSLCVFPVVINSLQFGFEKYLPVGTVCLFEIESHSVSQANLETYQAVPCLCLQSAGPGLLPQAWLIRMTCRMSHLHLRVVRILFSFGFAPISRI